MHEGGEDPVGQLRQMKVGKSPAIRKTVFVDRAFIAFQEMAGNGVDDQLATHAFFKVFDLGLGKAFIQYKGKVICFCGSDRDHEAPAAIAAGGTINLWLNNRIQFHCQCINQVVGLPFQEILEPFVLCQLQVGLERDECEICLDG